MSIRSRMPWYILMACVGFAPLATTATSLMLDSLPLTYDSYVIPRLAALGVLTALALVAWVATGGALRWRRSVWALAAFIVLAGISTATALDPAVALFGKDAANGFIAFLCYGAVFMLVLSQATGTDRVMQLTRVVVGSGTAAAVASLYQAARMTTAYVESLGLGDVGFLYGRGGGVFGNPDFVGAFLVLPLVVGVGLTLAEQDRRWKIASALGTFCIAAALVVTQVRAGWLGAAAGIVTLVAIALPRSQQMTRKTLAISGGVLLAALALGVLIITPAGIVDRLGVGAGEGLDAVSSGRLTGWRDAVAVIADRPLTGTGADSFTYGWYRHAAALADPVTGARSYFEDPHNVYLAIAATMGVPAVIALVAVLGLAVHSGIVAVRDTADHPRARTIFAAWLAAVVGMLVTALFAVTTIPMMLQLLVGAAVLLAPGARTVRWSSGTGLALRAGAGVLALLLAICAIVPFVADYQLGQYMRTRDMNTLERARSLAPWEKTIHGQYIAVRRAELLPLMNSGSAQAIEAALAFDNELYGLIERHPHELIYTIERLDFLGQAAGLLGPALGEKAFTVSGLATVDYPGLTDFSIYRARALNNLDRYDEAAAILQPMGRSVSRDIALTETLLLLGDKAGARTLAEEIDERYPASALAEAFLAQPTISELMGG